MAKVLVQFENDDGSILATYSSQPTQEDLKSAIEYFSAAEQYQPLLIDGSQNPEAAPDFMIRKMKEYCENVITSFAAQSAADAARAAVLSKPVTL